MNHCELKNRWGLNPINHTFSPGLLFFRTLQCSRKVHSTEIKTIGDKYNCDPYAFLLCLQVWCSFCDTRHFDDVKMKCGKRAHNRAISSWSKLVMMSKKVPYWCSILVLGFRDWQVCAWRWKFETTTCMIDIGYLSLIHIWRCRRIR